MKYVWYGYTLNISLKKELRNDSLILGALNQNTDVEIWLSPVLLYIFYYAIYFELIHIIIIPFSSISSYVITICGYFFFLQENNDIYQQWQTYIVSVTTESTIIFDVSIYLYSFRACIFSSCVCQCTYLWR